MSFNRRSFLALAATSAAFGGLSRAFAQPAAAEDYRNEVAGYGPLRSDPKGVFDLPEGFEYRIVSQAGQPMDDGLVTPWKMDGMACFPAGSDRVALVRNHELKPLDVDRSAFGPGRSLVGKVPADRIYGRADNGQPMNGGTTSLVWDVRERRLVAHHLSLAGTSTNCAGGLTPRGTWLSCEETTQAKGLEAMQDHGWVFEVPANLRGIADPAPIVGMGRFKHEATATDPRTGIVYLTEDEGDGAGLFYRYLPNDPARLLAGGRLQALGFKEGAEADPRNWERPFMAPGDWRETMWVDLDGVDNPYTDLRYRGHAKGAAWFARGEGVFFGKDELFFTCTSGGPSARGQIFRYVPSPEEGRPGERDKPGRLQLFVQPTDGAVMDMCDNIAISPWGHLFVCEDKTVGRNMLKAVTPQGRTYTVGRNPSTTLNDDDANSELAGVCFSPDGSTLFVNLYMPGTTLAVTGPWASLRA
ncbi:MAG: alkaline phosphatase PhoX [Phenylobacterium sp.]